MARRDSETQEMQLKFERVRLPLRNFIVCEIPPSVLREVTGGEGEDNIQHSPDSPVPPTKG
jgi:hypothetical protein